MVGGAEPPVNLAAGDCDHRVPGGGDGTLTRVFRTLFSGRASWRPPHVPGILASRPFVPEVSERC